MTRKSFWAATAGLVLCLIPGPLNGQARCLEENLRIGQGGGLRFVLDMDIDDQGRIYVTQALTPFVTRFNASGQLDLRIGAAGSAPGEFMISASRLGWIGDTLYATDVEKVNYFSRDGRSLGQTRWRRVVPEQFSAFHPWLRLPDGSFLGSRSIEGSGWYELGRIPLLRFSAAGAVLDTVALVNRPWETSFVRIPGSPPRYFRHPLGPWADISSLPATVTSDRAGVLLLGDVDYEGRVFKIVKASMSGDTVLTFDVPFSPKVIEPGDATRLRDTFAAVRAGDHDDPPPQRTAVVTEQLRTAAREALHVPAYYPPVRQIVAGEDDSIWLLREFDWSGSDVWDVYTGEGRYQWSVDVRRPFRRNPFNDRFVPLHVTRSTVWAMTFAEDETPVLTRYGVSICG